MALYLKHWHCLMSWQCSSSSGTCLEIGCRTCIIQTSFVKRECNVNTVYCAHMYVLACYNRKATYSTVSWETFYDLPQLCTVQLLGDAWLLDINTTTAVNIYWTLCSKWKLLCDGMMSKK